VNKFGVFCGTGRRVAILQPVLRDDGSWPRRLEPRSSVTAYARADALSLPGHLIQCAYAMTDCGLTPCLSCGHSTAPAREGFQPLVVEDCKDASTVLDEMFLLKRARDDRDSRKHSNIPVV
jgi:hypothetical protein